MNVIEQNLAAHAAVIYNQHAGNGEAKLAAERFQRIHKFPGLFSFNEYLANSQAILKAHQFLIVMGGDGTHTSVLQTALLSELTDPLFVLLLGFGGQEVFADVMNTKKNPNAVITSVLSGEYTEHQLRPLRVQTESTPESLLATWFAIGGFTGRVLENIEQWRAQNIQDQVRRPLGTIQAYWHMLQSTSDVEITKPDGSSTMALDAGVISPDVPKWGTVEIPPCGALPLIHIIGEYSSLDERNSAIKWLALQGIVSTFLPSLTTILGERRVIRHTPLQPGESVGLRLTRQHLTVDAEKIKAFEATIQALTENDRSYRPVRVLRLTK